MRLRNEPAWIAGLGSRVVIGLTVLLGLATTTSAQVALQYSFGGPAGISEYAISVDNIADLDGDGTRDLIIGASNYIPFTTTYGLVEVRSGATGSIIHSISSPLASDALGCSVAAVGDVDSDAVPDFVVGAYRSNISGLDTGRVDVFSGASGSLILSIIGPAPGALFGTKVVHLEDVNGDGVTDLAVSAPGFGPGGTAYVFSGQTGGVIQFIQGTAAQPLGSIMQRVGDMDFDGKDDLVMGSTTAHTLGGTYTGFVEVYSTLTGALRHHVNGQDYLGYFGRSISRTGDVNNDGVPDLIVSAYRANMNAAITSAGRVFMISGLDGSVIYDFTGTHVHENTGDSVLGVSDLTGDGVSDFLVARSGSFYGGALGTTCVTIHSGKTGAVIKVLRDATGAYVSGSLRSVGDLNGDGLEDIMLVTASGSANYPSSCSVYLSSLLTVPSIGGGQANSAAANLRINEISTAAVPGPFTSTLLRQHWFSIDIQGAPFSLYEVYGATTLNPGGWTFPGFGSLDIGTGPTFSDVTVFFPGFSSGFPLYMLDLNGEAHHRFYVPPGWPAGSIGAIQALVQIPQPWVGNVWATLSAAHELVLP